MSAVIAQMLNVSSESRIQESRLVSTLNRSFEISKLQSLSFLSRFERLEFQKLAGSHALDPHCSTPSFEYPRDPGCNICVHSDSSNKEVCAAIQRKETSIFKPLLHLFFNNEPRALFSYVMSYHFACQISRSTTSYIYGDILRHVEFFFKRHWSRATRGLNEGYKFARVRTHTTIQDVLWDLSLSIPLPTLPRFDTVLCTHTRRAHAHRVLPPIHAVRTRTTKHSGLNIFWASLHPRGIRHLKVRIALSQIQSFPNSRFEERAQWASLLCRAWIRKLQWQPPWVLRSIATCWYRRL